MRLYMLPNSLRPNSLAPCAESLKTNDCHSQSGSSLMHLGRDAQWSGKWEPRENLLLSLVCDQRATATFRSSLRSVQP
jgi:hypothetical protein